MNLTISPQTTELACGTRGAAAACVDVLREVVAELDPATLLAAEAPDVWALFDQGEKLCAAAKVLVARRVDESDVWKEAGLRSAAEYLALRGGTTRDAARDAITTSQRLSDLPKVEAALRRGELSVAQAHPIADAASHDPTAESALLDHAKTASLKELRDECLRRKVTADPKPNDTRDRIYKARYFRLSTDAEGAWKLHGRGPLDHAGTFGATLNPLIDDLFRQARKDGKREDRGALAYDALQEMARLAHATLYGYDPDPTPANANIGRVDPSESHVSPSSSAGKDGDPGAGTACNSNAGSPGEDDSTANPNSGTAAEDDSTACDLNTGSSAQDDCTGGDSSSGNGGTSRPEPGGTYPQDNSHESPAVSEDHTSTQSQVPGSCDEANGNGTLAGVEPAQGQAQSSASRRKAHSNPARQPNPTRLALIRLDLAALRRGRTEPGEICHLAGSGPITVPAARSLLDRSVTKLVISNGCRVVNVTHIGTGARATERLGLGPPALLQPQPRPLPPTHLTLVHLDAHALLSQTQHASCGSCTIPGVGTVAVATAHSLLGPSLLARVIASGVAVAGYVHRGRKATVPQRTALFWVEPECSVAGCPHSFVEIDHRADWAKTQVTQLETLDRLCTHHHRLKTYQGWALVEGPANATWSHPATPATRRHHHPEVVGQQAPGRNVNHQVTARLEPRSDARTPTRPALPEAETLGKRRQEVRGR